MPRSRSKSPKQGRGSSAVSDARKRTATPGSVARKRKAAHALVLKAERSSAPSEGSSRGASSGRRSKSAVRGTKKKVGEKQEASSFGRLMSHFFGSTPGGGTTAIKERSTSKGSEQDELRAVADGEAAAEDLESGQLLENGASKKRRSSMSRKAAETRKSSTPNLTGDFGNIIILLVLYTLQGIPMGFASTIPLLMKERGVSYSIIGVFALTSWPFSLKLLWAPIVDSCYIDALGRRKTWLVPTQVAIGIVMIVLSTVFNEWCGGLDMLDPNKNLGEINIQGLTASFFFLYFLCATQDIAVDGWALTILREENVGYGPTCNAIGQTFGYAFTFIGALSLNHFQVVGFDNFMYLCGVSFLVTTLVVAAFKAERAVPDDEEVESMKAVYKKLLAMWRLPTIRTLVLILFFWKVPYAGCEAVVTLKMQDKGIPKEHIAYIGSACTVLSCFIPVLVSKQTSGARPFDMCMGLYLPRIWMCFVSMAMVYFCPSLVGKTMEDFPYGYYAALVATSIIGVYISTASFVAQMSYFAQVSPKDIGGTYMTLLNTFANMGGMWVTPVAFQLVDALTIKTSSDSGSSEATVVVDGFYVTSCICASIGFMGYSTLRRTAEKLQIYPKSAWNIES
ncbi:unnamed protein product [Amoebophrya sp. A25]|nr:unnamed protein product [Amoebophrya sp. A25]|eukprot:GSA25T00005845001.1